MKYKTLALLSGLLLTPLISVAQQGVAISYGNNWLYQSDPDNTSGINIAYTIQPDSWVWNNFTLGFNFSYSYWHTRQANVPNTSLSTYGAAPVLRWYFWKNSVVSPFLQGSIGAAYLSNSYFGGRNLGSSLLFQDMGGIGLAFGPKKQFYLTLQSMHYSNAGLSSANSGFTIPLLMTVGYNFQ